MRGTVQKRFRFQTIQTWLWQWVVMPKRRAAWLDLCVSLAHLSCTNRNWGGKIPNRSMVFCVLACLVILASSELLMVDVGVSKLFFGELLFARVGKSGLTSHLVERVLTQRHQGCARRHGALQLERGLSQHRSRLLDMHRSAVVHLSVWSSLSRYTRQRVFEGQGHQLGDCVDSRKWIYPSYDVQLLVSGSLPIWNAWSNRYCLMNGPKGLLCRLKYELRSVSPHDL